MRHPYADFLRNVEKPSRYVGGEYHEVRKDPAAVAARVCLAFPDAYEIGMSHLGTKILYGVLNREADIACERAFAPWLDCEAELRARKLPLVTLESATPLAQFDVLGFSLQYELTYTNVLNMLDLGGIPLRASARGDADPLILCGGPTATHPEPLAPFIDAFFIGEAEERVPDLVREAAALRRAGVPRRERLIRLAAAFPLYAPELYATEVDGETGFVVVGAPCDPRVPARPRRAVVSDINRFPFPDDSPLPYGEAIFDRMAVEVARGCTEGCRFCQAGIIYRPVRERDPVAVLDALTGGVAKGGYDETALTSLSMADYSCVTPLVKAAMARLAPERVSLSVSSLRAYGLNEDLLGEMASVRAQGLTFAPEAGTQRMRDVIAKNVTEDDIAASAERVFGRGFPRMKLYFMIGLPTEQDEDVAGIIETAARVQAIGRRHQKGAEVTASVSTHVPKPHTPFQWAAMDSEAETARKQTILAERARARRVPLKMHANAQSHVEGMFSRGDRRVAEVLERAFRLGCRFDGWDEVLRIDLWDRAIAETAALNEPAGQGTSDGQGGLESQALSQAFLARYLGTIPVTARLPWDHIDIGLEPDFLLKEYRKALKDRLSPPCGKPYKRLLHPNNVAEAEGAAAAKLVCYDCGIACDLDAMKRERLFYLRRMNAWAAPLTGARPPAAPAGAPADAAAPAPSADLKRPSKRPSPPARPWQGPAHRYRLRYTKLGRVAFLGHLDLVRHLPRIFRRAGLDIFYSVGFHPKPELSFGPALGLGIPSLAELVDITLTDDIDPADLLGRLASVSLDGISFRAAVRLGNNDRALGRVVSEAEYVVRLPSPVHVAQAAARVIAQEPLLVRREAERAGGIGRVVDVRRTLRSLEQAEDEGLCRVLDWPLDTPGRLVRLRVAVSAEGGARPREIVDSLCGDGVGQESDFARVGLYADGGADALEVTLLSTILAQEAGEQSTTPSP